MASQVDTVIRTVNTATADRPLLRSLVWLWAGINAVEFVVWALICVATLHIGSPWWLWTTAIPGGIALGAAWYFGDPKRQTTG